MTHQQQNPGDGCNRPGASVNLREQVNMANPTCTIDGCERLHLARGYCGTHYKRWKLTGNPGTAVVRQVVRRTETVCAVDGCSRPRIQREWCKAHYARWRRHGDVGSAELLDRTTPRLCSIAGCELPHDSNGYCSPHAHRQRRYGSPEGTSMRPAAGDPARWRMATVGYMGAHNRTRRLRGPADRQQCVDCGGQAHDWAYDHLDSNEQWEQFGQFALPYSSSPTHYIPLCRSCHVVFDKQYT